MYFGVLFSLKVSIITMSPGLENSVLSLFPVPTSESTTFCVNLFSEIHLQ